MVEVLFFFYFLNLFLVALQAVVLSRQFAAEMTEFAEAILGNVDEFQLVI